MDKLPSTTTTHKKEKHLSFGEHVIIQLRLKDWAPIRSIYI